MRAVTWQGKEKMEVRNVSDPTIIEPTDAIIRVTATAICGSDLHLYHHGGALLVMNQWGSLKKSAVKFKN